MICGDRCELRKPTEGAKRPVAEEEEGRKLCRITF